MNETTLPPPFQMALAAMKDQAKAVMAADRGALCDAQNRMHAQHRECCVIVTAALQRGWAIPDVSEEELLIELKTFRWLTKGKCKTK